jgi:hydroxymethylbilane synthase
MDIITIGTRGSKLALWQANFIKSEIERKYNNIKVDLKIIKTKGDKILDVPLAMVGGKGLFVKEIEDALLKNEVDLAVHSMKDVPTFFPEGLYLPIITKREDYRDAFISRDGTTLEDLPENSVVGTSSLRRKSQLKNIKKNIQIKDLRGNVDTRLKKLKNGEYDAIILASAGLKRLGFEEEITQYIDKDLMLPAIGQGALGIEIRENDKELLERLLFLKDEDTYFAVKGERAFLRKLEGGCQVPIACFGEVSGDNLILDGLVASLDGEKIIRKQIQGIKTDFDKLGTELGEIVLDAGGKEILDEVYCEEGFGKG